MKARGVVFKIDRAQWADSKGEYHCQFEYTLWQDGSYSKPFIVVNPALEVRPGDVVEIDFVPVQNEREHHIVKSINKLEDEGCQKKKRKQRKIRSSTYFYRRS